MKSGDPMIGRSGEQKHRVIGRSGDRVNKYIERSAECPSNKTLDVPRILFTRSPITRSPDHPVLSRVRSSQYIQKRLQVALRVGDIEEAVPHIQPGNRVVHFRLSKKSLGVGYLY